MGKRGPKPSELTERLDLRLSPEERRILGDKAEKTRRSFSSLIRQLIDEIDKVIP